MGFPETFKALADPVRREILLMLRGGRMAAGDISARFDMTGATVSYHLSQLKKAGLIYETKEKNFIYYSLNQFTDAAHGDNSETNTSKREENSNEPKQNFKENTY